MHYALTKRFCIFHHCGLNANKNQRLIANIMCEANDRNKNVNALYINAYKRLQRNKSMKNNKFHSNFPTISSLLYIRLLLYPCTSIYIYIPKPT